MTDGHSDEIESGVRRPPEVKRKTGQQAKQQATAELLLHDGWTRAPRANERER